MKGIPNAEPSAEKIGARLFEDGDLECRNEPQAPARGDPELKREPEDAANR